jgi:hypothetical protein
MAVVQMRVLRLIGQHLVPKLHLGSHLLVPQAEWPDASPD